MTPQELQAVVDAHGRWLRREEGGVRANLTRANLTRANLTHANLRGANLTLADLTHANLRGAYLRGADLWGADLRGADLTHAKLTGANLTGAKLRGANLGGAALPTGEIWEDYLAKVVPAFLTAGGKALSEVATPEHWACHDWTNCPTAAAFGARGLDVPLLLRPRAEQFIQFFDAGLIPLEAIV